MLTDLVELDPIEQSLETRIFDLSRWVTNSGIQNTSEPHKGSFNSWFDISRREYCFVYSEITGYGITTLLFLDEVEKAKQAADWIISNAMFDMGDGAKGVNTSFKVNHNDASRILFDETTVCSFDTGMVLNGMIQLFTKTTDVKYYRASQALGNFLDVMQKRDGSLHAYYDIKSGKFIDQGEKWSTQSGSYHAKVAMGLVDLANTGSSQEYRYIANGLCDYVLSNQQSNGRFISFSNTGDTNVHPHCYSAEGLFYVGKKLGNQRYIDSAKKATEWSLDNIDRIGQLYCAENDTFSGDERSDIFSQILRLGALFTRDDSEFKKHYSHQFSTLVRTILSYQEQGGELRQFGGIRYGNHMIGRNVNSWCSMFALQALTYYQQVMIEGQKINERLLI